MNSDKGRDAELENKEKYEATVLEFLDKEMASAQPMAKDEQSEELDALVTDLLKQVITEADQPKDGNKLLLDDEDELFAGLTTEQKQSAIAVSTAPPVKVEQPPKAAAPIVPAPVTTPLPAESETAMEPGPVLESSTAETAPATVFSFSMASKQKLPVLAAAGACVLVIVGAAIYFLSGNSSKVMNKPDSQIALTQPAPAATHPASGPIAAVAEPQIKPAVLPAPSASPTKGPAANQAPTVHTKKQLTPVIAPAAPKPEPLPAATVPPTPVREEKVQSPQAAAPASATETGAASVEKPSASSANENAAPVNPLTMPKSPVPLMPAANPVSVSSSPVSQPAAQPASAPSVAPKPLMAAVPVSQVSPVYPDLAVRARASGTVVLELQINEQGRVIKATPVDGPSIFREAAVSAAMKWRYRPASIGGVNVPSQSKVTMVFNLKK